MYTNIMGISWADDAWVVNDIIQVHHSKFLQSVGAHYTPSIRDDSEQ